MLTPAGSFRAAARNLGFPLNGAVASRDASFLGMTRSASAIPSGPDQGSLWVQPPNHGRAGGLAPDFFEMFTTRMDEWEEARRFVAVWVLRITSLVGEHVAVGDDFLRDAFLPRLEAWGIELAVNVTGATLAQCGAHLSRLDVEGDAVQHLIDLGGNVSYLSLQSPLSKVRNRECPDYGREAGYDLRVADVVRYMTTMHERFPEVNIGLVDAMPAKGWEYQEVYRDLVAALAAQGMELAFLHLDFPMESATPGWENVREAEKFIRGELGVPFGLLYVSKIGGETSNVAFRDNVLDGYRTFHAAGGRPDHLELTSWYAYPATMLPEDDETTAPFMNLVRDFTRLGGVTPRPSLASGTPSASAP
jgi:hypothetical protein